MARDPVQLMNMLDGLLGGGGRDTRWKSTNTEALEKALDRRTRGVVLPAGTFVTSMMMPPDTVCVVIGPVSLQNPIVEGKKDHPFYGETFDTLIACLRPIGALSEGPSQNNAIMVAPGWSLTVRDKTTVPESDAIRALDAVIGYTRKHEFSQGQPVTWKEGFNNRRQSGTFLFVDYIEPRFDSSEDLTPLSLETFCDCRVLIAVGGEPGMFVMDSQRLRPA